MSKKLNHVIDREVPVVGKKVTFLCGKQKKTTGVPSRKADSCTLCVLLMIQQVDISSDLDRSTIESLVRQFPEGSATQTPDGGWDVTITHFAENMLVGPDHVLSTRHVIAGPWLPVPEELA